MNDAFQELFDAVRRACSPAAWSRGVELQRAGAVHFDRSDDEEVVFRIAARGGMISRVVQLFPEDRDWECECAGPDHGCEHAAAAVITWRRTIEAGKDLKTAGSEHGRVGYRFSREGNDLALERVIVVGETSRPLETTLAAVATGRVAGPRFVASQADLAVELALETHRRGKLERRVIPTLFARLAHCPDVKLEGRDVEVSAEPVTPLAMLEDQGDGFRLSIVEDPSVREAFSNGVARCGRTLRPFGELKLTGRELHELPRGRYFGSDSVAELVTEVIPDLRKRVPLEIRTERLPDTEHIPPRIHLETRREGRELEVMATLVYGDPPQGRVDAGRLVHLGGAVPARDEARERKLLQRLRRELSLTPGVRVTFEGEEAVAFTSRLERWRGRVPDAAADQFRLAAPLVPRLHASASDFEIEFESLAGAGEATSGGARRADPEEVIRAWSAGESLVPLLEGGWAPLPADWLARYGHRIADLLAARRERGELPRSSLPELARLCEELDQPAPAEFHDLARALEDFTGIPAATLPADLTAELRSYQRTGVDWLVFMRDAGLGALLADDMGLGKTLQALCGLDGRALVVAPTSVLHNWVEEARRFRPGLRVAVYHGPGRAIDREADLTLTTLSLIHI